MLPPALYRVMETAPWLSIPVGVVAVGTGVFLGLSTPFGLVRHWWVIQKLAIATAVIVTDAVLVGRIARSAVLTGHAEAALYGSTIAHVVVLATATALSVSNQAAARPGAECGPTRHPIRPRLT